jgi:hypothetical protein
LQQVANVVQSIRALDTKPHMGLLMHILGQNELPRHLVMALEQASQPNQFVSCLTSLGIEADKIEAKLDELQQALLQSFPKQTSPCDKYSYAQFARARRQVDARGLSTSGSSSLGWSRRSERHGSP